MNEAEALGEIIYSEKIQRKIEEGAMICVSDYGVDYEEAKAVIACVFKGQIAEVKIEEWKRQADAVSDANR